MAQSTRLSELASYTCLDDPVTYKIKWTEIKAQVIRFMKDLIRTADILIDTPVAIETLFDHLSSEPEVLQPGLVIIDGLSVSVRAGSTIKPLRISVASPSPAHTGVSKI